MPFKAEITYVVRRSLKMSAEKTYPVGEEYPYTGTPGDQKLERVGYIEPKFSYQCRVGRCRKEFPTIPELLEHEASHDSEK